MNNQEKHGPRPIGHAMARYMEELKNGDPVGRELEQAFRRGYAHGAATGISAMIEVLHQGISLDDVVAMSNAFEADLDQWRRGELGSRPPEFVVAPYLKRIQENRKLRQGRED